MGKDPSKSEGDSKVSAKSTFKISQEPSVPGRTIPEPPAAAKSVVSDVVIEFAPEPAIPYEALGELPKTYETGSVFLAARDPHWLFVYWDVDLEAFDKVVMLDGESSFYLKIFKAGTELVDQIKINSQARNWYFPIKDAGVDYVVELGFNNLECRWSVIGRSNTAAAPADTFSDGATEFATVPFHLSFQKMLDLVHSRMDSGDSLVGALSKMQLPETTGLQALAASWTDEQKRLLEALVGEDLVNQISLGSGEIDQIFRKRLSEALSERLSSEASSELSFLRSLAGSEWLPGESSLSSGFSASWSSAAAGSGESSATSSWQIGLGGLSSYGALGTLGSLSSYAGGASGGMESIGFMGSEVGASWLGAALGGSSWGWGGESSWAGALGSSWSAQPFSTNRERGFFMHVNAEVIFYGGTHPDATVWIDGKSVALAPDGSFRYHFRLPDGDFDIPIIAESPDGVEIRSATLSFHRGTVRTGEVGHTGQPAGLNEPMGRR